jgi:hypothetical protein
MNTVFGLAAAAIGILIGMAIMWPVLRKGASSKEAEAKRWKLLWQGGLIGWILAIVLVQVIVGLREEFDEINRQRDESMRQTNKLYQEQTDIIRKQETKP